MFIHSMLTQHISGIIMPIVRRTDSIKPCLVLACMCWLRLCGCVNAGIQIPAFTQCAQLVSWLHTTAASTYRLTPDARFYTVCSPDDGHNDARNMLS